MVQPISSISLYCTTVLHPSERAFFYPCPIPHILDTNFSRPQKELTLGRVWGRALQPEEVIQEATCSGGAAGPLVDWPAGAEVLQLLHRGAGVLAVEKEGSCPLQWEDGEQRLVGFSQRLKFHEAGVKCKGLGGTQVDVLSAKNSIFLLFYFSFLSR